MPNVTHRVAIIVSPKALVPLSLGALLLASGCGDDDEGPDDAGPPNPPAADVVEPSAVLVKKLRSWEYRNTIASLLGDQITIDVSLPPDLVRANFSSVSASLDCYSDVDVEAFEQAALSVAEQAFAASPNPLQAAGCESGSAADSCVGDFIASFGRSAWRRPLTADEHTKYQQLAVTLTDTFDGDVTRGVTYTVAGLLQSPNFLYRVELGEEFDDDPNTRKYTPFEMATRLAYTLWETTPDEYLLDAAQAGELTSEESVRHYASVMLTHPRAAAPLQRFWREHLAVDRLTLENHPTPDGDASLYADMRLEGQYMAARLADPGVDAMQFLTSSEAWLTPQLAAHYGIEAPNQPGWVSLPAERRGFLTSGVFLASNAHPGKTSPTRRGKFVVERLLCGWVPPPPADVDLSLPDVDVGEATRREQMEMHSTEPACAGCHQILDPPGFAFENYDALGVYRTMDNELPVDASGEYEGQAFAGAMDMISIVQRSPDAPRCITQQAFRNTLGQVESLAQQPYIDEFNEKFVANGHDLHALLVDIVSSPAFRYGRVTEVELPTNE